MTTNQIAYLQAQEARRANLEKERQVDYQNRIKDREMAVNEAKQRLAERMEGYEKFGKVAKGIGDIAGGVGSIGKGIGAVEGPLLKSRSDDQRLDLEIFKANQ